MPQGVPKIHFGPFPSLQWGGIAHYKPESELFAVNIFSGCSQVFQLIMDSFAPIKQTPCCILAPRSCKNTLILATFWYFETPPSPYGKIVFNFELRHIGVSSNNRKKGCPTSVLINVSSELLPVLTPV